MARVTQKDEMEAERLRCLGVEEKRTKIGTKQLRLIIFHFVAGQPRPSYFQPPPKARYKSTLDPIKFIFNSTNSF